MHDLARAMRLELDGAESGALGRRPTGKVEAYQAYLQGRYLWNQRGEANLQRAIVQFNRAIELDPGFALSHAALADVHTALGYLGLVRPAAAFPVARPHALKALELDPSLAEAHAALAYIKFYFDWDWAGARAEFRRALELDASNPVSHQWYALYLLAAGHPQEAGREIETAHRLDPLSLAINTDVGLHHYYNGRYPAAVAQLRSVLAMKGDFLLAHLWLARTYLQMGRFDEAIAEVDPGKGREWPVLVAARGFAYGVAGRADEAHAVLREMEVLSQRRFVTAYGVALVHAGLRRNDEAFEWLEKAFEERSHWLVWLRQDPRWNNIRTDPRFGPLLARMKYPA
jgi:tetratricopeptide (TPR) repeat protein